MKAKRTDSQLGGTPALPEGVTWPRDEKGQLMHFCAQLRCDQARLPEGPSHGLLLFFISDDALMSLGLRGSCRVLHVPLVPEEALPDLANELREVAAYAHAAVARPAAIAAMGGDLQRISVQDYRFERVVPGLTASQKKAWQKKAFFGRAKVFHQLGGYPFFTQEDTRRTTDDPELDLLLLQLDSDGQFGTRWGDNGIVHFFINAEDLADGDFTRVRFSGDCY